MARSKTHPTAGVEVTPPPDATEENSTLIIQAVRQVAETLDSALILAEAENVMHLKRSKATSLVTLDDDKKTKPLLVLLREHPDFMVKALALAPPRLASAVISTKEGEQFLYPQPWWSPFFSALATWGSMRQATRTVDVAYHTVLHVKAHSPTFRLLYELAMDLSVQTLEDEAKRRALGGSDILLIFMLKGAAPEKYKERVEVVEPAVIRRKAERLAARLGLDPDELMAIAEEISAQDGSDEGARE